MLKMVFAWLILSVLFSSSNAAEIDLLECPPPDAPVLGGYDPKSSYYMPGDVVHYYCDVETYISGIPERKCLDTGIWSGYTPVCDTPATFKAVFQSTDIDDDSTANAAVDGIRSTCSETIGGEKEEWSGNFTQKGELMRVMLFLPKGPANFEIVLVKANGDEVVCGRYEKIIDVFDWTIQDCPNDQDQTAVGLKIRSLSYDPLIICEIHAYVLTSPKCVDPLYLIESGHLRMTRKTATLMCDHGYTRSPDVTLECVRDGQWNRKRLFCAVLECPPPDAPVLGGYDPKLYYYMPGDVVHYYCDVEYYISGIPERKCLDTGKWSGYAPVCERDWKLDPRQRRPGIDGNL